MRAFFSPVQPPEWLLSYSTVLREALGDIWHRPLRVKDYSTASLPDAATFKQGLAYDSDEQVLKYSDGTQWRTVLSDLGTPYESHLIELGDETTAITTGTAKKTVRWPYRFQLEHPDGTIGVRAGLTTASSSGNPAVDINQDGVSIFSTTLTIDANEKTSKTAGTAAVLSNAILEDDAELTFDIDTAGTGAAGLKIWLIGQRIAGEDGILLEGDMNTTGNDLELLDGDMTDGDDFLLQQAA